MNYIIYCFKHYADFKGRARRAEFWWFTFFNCIISIVILIFAMVPLIRTLVDNIEILDESGTIPTELFSTLINPATFIYLIWLAVILVPSLSVTVRRLHDIGRSATWLLIYWGVSFLLNFFSYIFDGNLLGTLFSILTFGIFIWFLVWMFTNSQIGPNEYGPNPKGVGNPEGTKQIEE